MSIEPMEISEFASRIVESPCLDDKLRPAPETLTDDERPPARFLSHPAREPRIEIVPARQTRVPPLEGMGDPAQRVRIIHALANHELQAAELFAWALVAFPRTPRAFRRGLLTILGDEQRHTRLYAECLERRGARFGDFPLNGYFWNKVDRIRTPQQFVCTMGLTFENANLDHTVDYAAAARQSGDEELADVIDVVHRDEIRHVRFGWRWLQIFKSADQSAWDAYCESITWPLRPGLARGAEFHPEGRQAAGLDAKFIRKLSESIPGKNVPLDALDARDGSPSRNRS